MPKKHEEIEEVKVSEKEILLALYKELQDRNIRSISDLEHQISLLN